MQNKTQRPVQVELTAAARDALQAWIKLAGLRSEAFLFPSRLHDSPHLGTRQYARVLQHWVEELGLDRADYGMHSMRRTKATLIYRRTKNLRAVQLRDLRADGNLRKAKMSDRVGNFQDSGCWGRKLGG